MKITKFNEINVEIFQNLIIFLTCNNNLTLYIFLIASILVIRSTNIRNSMNYYKINTEIFFERLEFYFNFQKSEYYSIRKFFLISKVCQLIFGYEE